MVSQDDPAKLTQRDKDNQKKKQQQQPISAGGVSRGVEREKTPITEYTRKVDLEPEVEGWLEKVEKESSQLKTPVQDDKGQVVLDDSAVGDKGGFKVVLPMTKKEVDKGLHHKVMDSVRWLAEWCIRMVKMFGNKVAYRKEK